MTHKAKRAQEILRQERKLKETYGLAVQEDNQKEYEQWQEQREELVNPEYADYYFHHNN